MRALLMGQRRVVAMLALAVAVFACGSDSTDPGSNNNNGNTNNTNSCTVTLSGAQTGSPACSKVTATWTSNNNTTSVGIAAAGSADTVNVGITFQGVPTSTRYNAANTSSAIMLVFNGAAGWENSPTTSWSLTITSVSALDAGGAGLRGYQVHGTFTATLASIVNTTVGPVTVSAVF